MQKKDIGLQTACKEIYLPLVLSAREAILMGLDRAWEITKNSHPTETDYLYSIIDNSFKKIAREWNYFLSEYKINFSLISVYCHQRPIVKYDQKIKGCELGDLLLVHTHKTTNGRTYRNALLLQAKATDKLPYKLKHGELNQLKLYLEWPDFKYSKPKKNHTISITPKTFHSGAMYMLINKNHWQHQTKSTMLNKFCLSFLKEFYNEHIDELCSCYHHLNMGLDYYCHHKVPIYISVPDQIMDSNLSFDRVLVDFLRFTIGQQFSSENEAKKKNDWSRLIWDLLQLSTDKMFKLKSSGVVNGIRLIDHTTEHHYYHTADHNMLKNNSIIRELNCDGKYYELLNNENNPSSANNNNSIPPTDRGDKIKEEDDGAISTIIIETSAIPE